MRKLFLLILATGGFCAFPHLLFGMSIEEAMGKDWQCLLMPNSLFGPGVIYEVVPTGGQRYLQDLSPDKAYVLRSGVAAVGKATDTKDLSGAAYVGLLERLVKGAKVALGGKVQSKYTTSTEYAIDKYVVSPLQSARYAEKWFAKNVKPSPGSRYFLIREAVTASAIAYSADATTMGNLGGEVAVVKALNADIDLSGSKEGTYTLTRKLKPSLWVCLLTDELKLEKSISGEDIWTRSRSRMPVKEDLPTE